MQGLHSTVLMTSFPCYSCTMLPSCGRRSTGRQESGSKSTTSLRKTWRIPSFKRTTTLRFVFYTLRYCYTHQFLFTPSQIHLDDKETCHLYYVPKKILLDWFQGKSVSIGASQPLWQVLSDLLGDLEACDDLKGGVVANGEAFNGKSPDTVS